MNRTLLRALQIGGALVILGGALIIVLALVGVIDRQRAIDIAMTVSLVICACTAAGLGVAVLMGFGNSQ